MEAMVYNLKEGNDYEGFLDNSSREKQVEEDPLRTFSGRKFSMIMMFILRLRVLFLCFNIGRTGKI